VLWSDEKGLTLVEVMVAFTILVVAVLAMTNTFTSGFIISEHAGDATKAVTLAQSKIEELKALSDLSIGSETGEWDGGYQYQLNITDGEYDNLYRISIKVTYPTAGGQKDVIVRTMLWKR